MINYRSIRNGLTNLSFRSNHSTIDALVYIENFTQTAFYEKQHAIAFHMIWRFGILHQLYTWGLLETRPIFLKYVFGNQVFGVIVGQSKSSLMLLENGVLEGSVLVTSFFAISIHFLLFSTLDAIKAFLYVDDLIIRYPHSVDQNENTLQEEVNR